MNIYSKKQVWKIWLLVTASAIIIFSLWYTNLLVNKIALDERKKVKLWAEAIQKKATLVKYTNDLFNKIKGEERKKVELWANGTKQLANPALNMNDLSFIFEVIKNNETVPVILTNEQGSIISSRNLDSVQATEKEYLANELSMMKAQHNPIVINIIQGQKNYLYYKDSKLFSELKQNFDELINSFISEIVVNSASIPVILTDSSQGHVLAYGNIDSVKINNPQSTQKLINEMSSKNTPLEIELSENSKNYIFYQDSFLLTQLKYYPLIQFIVIGLFLLIAYTLFSTSRKAEQNQVWVGMSKETAHQLGTPLSSLMAWVEILKSKSLDPEIINELEKDTKRLETITERFSKIGSTPKLDSNNVYETLLGAVNYMKSRTSKNVQFIINAVDEKNTHALLNVPLFEWVIENLIRNAADAMNGTGVIKIELTHQNKLVYIDIADTGKGLQKSNFKTIFEPGFTTKKRGWGLGLSLSKRIIENYHSGKIFVKNSELDKGTTFRIILNV